DNKVFENANFLRNENLQLSVQNEKLRIEGNDGKPLNSTVIQLLISEHVNSLNLIYVSEAKLHEEVQQFKQKFLVQAEELTELHRRKGEHAQQIIDLTSRLQEQDKLVAVRDSNLAEVQAKNLSLQAEVSMLTHANKELKYINDTLRDEHRTLQLAFNVLEEKLRKAQVCYLRKRYAKMQKDLEEACRDASRVCSDDLQEGFGPLMQSTLPTKVAVKFDAHDGEVNAVKWSPVDRLVATGGADRKVKLWDISKGQSKSE
ncbi:hypothetical protein HUJ05_012210, partial [Dendroctonus ponderosae]